MKDQTAAGWYPRVTAVVLAVILCLAGWGNSAQAARGGKKANRPADTTTRSTGRNVDVVQTAEPDSSTVSEPTGAISLTSTVHPGYTESIEALIVSYGVSPGPAEVARIEELGGTVFRTLTRSSALAVELPSGSRPLLALEPDVTAIRQDHRLKPELDVAVETASLPVYPSVHEGLTGAGVGIAIIDSGLAVHYDLQDRIVHALDMTRSAIFAEYLPNNTLDTWGHGTHVAGILMGDGFDSDGQYRGIAPEADLISIDVLDMNGIGYASDVIAALEYILDHKDAYGIRIVNLSLGHPVYLPAAEDPLVQMVEEAWEAGLVVVCSAGNLGRVGHFTITSPGNSSRVITVGALTDWNTPDRSDDLPAT